jgi:hypothetical protein
MFLPTFVDVKLVTRGILTEITEITVEKAENQ